MCHNYLHPTPFPLIKLLATELANTRKRFETIPFNRIYLGHPYALFQSAFFFIAYTITLLCCHLGDGRTEIITLEA